MSRPMITVELIHPQATPDTFGLIPFFLSTSDPRPAKDQFNERYAHGGGWTPISGFKLKPNQTLAYPGDPPMPLLARIKLHEETILLFPHAFVAIVQPDGTFEVSRLD